MRGSEGKRSVQCEGEQLSDEKGAQLRAEVERVLVERTLAHFGHDAALALHSELEKRRHLLAHAEARSGTRARMQSRRRASGSTVPPHSNTPLGATMTR